MKYTAKTVSGHGRGKFLGFPTFNLHIPKNLTLQTGIYAANVWLKGKKYMGAMHFGPVPTYQDEKDSLEIFVLDYDSDQDMDELTFEPLKRLRSIISFDSKEQLISQITEDVQETRALIQS